MDRVCIWIVSRNFENCEEEEREREKKRDKFHRLLDSSFEQKILRTRRLVSFRIT